jgi:hypothetical protein
MLSWGRAACTSYRVVSRRVASCRFVSRIWLFVVVVVVALRRVA